MARFIFILSLLQFSVSRATAQHLTNDVDLTLGVGKQQFSTSLSFVHSWRLGTKQKFGIGLGGRLTSYSARDQYYSTAPAQLTSGSTSPFIIFQNNIDANIDSLKLNSPSLGAMNLSVTLSYQLHKKLQLGFNIDVLGFSFGAKQTGQYINGSISKTDTAVPTPLNLLLISDNDRGTLNSEFFVRFQVHKNWSAKLGGQFLFTEYTTTTKVQQFPEPNDRFRNKSLLLLLGVGYRF